MSYRIFLEGDTEPVCVVAHVIAAIGATREVCDREQRPAYALNENDKRAVECQPRTCADGCNGCDECTDYEDETP